MKRKKTLRPGLIVSLFCVVCFLIVPLAGAEEETEVNYEKIHELYDKDEFTVSLLDNNLSAENIDEITEAKISEFESRFGQYLPAHYSSTPYVECGDEEEIVAYVFRVLPDGSTMAYSEIESKDAAASNMDNLSERVCSWINDELDEKTVQSLDNLDLRSEWSCEPELVQEHTTSRDYPGIGRARLTTSWFRDNQEDLDTKDFFYTKTALRTVPGIELSGYEPYRNHCPSVEIDSAYSLGSLYEHLPGACVKDADPQTTASETSFGISLGYWNCRLSSLIPDHGVERHNPSWEKFVWDETFSFWSSCASSSFDFKPGVYAKCTQSSARDGNTYVISRVTADCEEAWAIIDDGILSPAPLGNNYWGHIAKVRWNNGYVRV